MNKDSIYSELESSFYTDFDKTEILGSILMRNCNKNSEYSFLVINKLIALNLMKSDLVKADTLLKKAREIYTSKISNKYKIDFYNNLALIENQNLMHERSLKYSQNAIRLSTTIKDSVRLSESYIIRARLYLSQLDYTNVRRSLKLSQSYSKDTVSKIKSNFYFGRTFYMSNKDSALYYYNKSLKLAIKSNNLYFQAENYADIAFTYIFFQDTKNVKNYLDKAIAISEILRYNKLIHNIYYLKGLFYEVTKNYDEAVRNYEIALKDYGKYVSRVQIANCYLMLSSSLFHDGLFKEAYEYQWKYLNLNDSLFNIQKSKEFDDIRTKYEVEKKDNQITILEQDKQIAATRRNWIITSSALIIIVLFALFFFYKQRANIQKKLRLKEDTLHKKETQRLQKEKELAEVKALIKGQDKERHRIATELHDSIGGQLASISMGLTHLNSSLKIENLDQMSDRLKNTFSELRDLSHSLSRNYLIEKSLTKLIFELKQQYEKQNAFSVEVSIFPEELMYDLRHTIKHNLYRILQELMSNTYKYAKANLVQISLNYNEENLNVMYEDNGIGFDTKIRKKGIGFKNISERVSILEGNMNIEAHQGRGVHVLISIPIKLE